MKTRNHPQLLEILAVSKFSIGEEKGNLSTCKRKKH